MRQQNLDLPQTHISTDPFSNIISTKIHNKFELYYNYNQTKIIQYLYPNWC